MVMDPNGSMDPWLGTPILPAYFSVNVQRCHLPPRLKLTYLPYGAVLQRSYS